VRNTYCISETNDENKLVYELFSQILIQKIRDDDNAI
jgi:hypothetical protein